MLTFATTFPEKNKMNPAHILALCVFIPSLLYFTHDFYYGGIKITGSFMAFLVCAIFIPFLFYIQRVNRKREAGE